MQNSYRPRLSIDIDEELFNKLNDLIGDLRLKSKLYQKITYDLVRALELMTPRQRTFFILSVVDSKITIEEYCKGIREAKDEAKKLDPKTTGPDS